MFAAYGGNTAKGIAERSATMLADELAQEYWTRKREQERREAEELVLLQNREQHLKRQMELAHDRREELAEKLGISIPSRITYGEIERRACKLFNCSRTDIRSARRHRDIVFVRQFISYWVARRTALSMPQIGKLMGGRDHTTVLHAKRMYTRNRAKMGRRLREVR